MINGEYRTEQVLIEYIKDSLNRFQSSYCGPNCRHCNRHPSVLRRVWWRIEDVVNVMRYGCESKEEYILERYFNEKKEKEKNES